MLDMTKTIENTSIDTFLKKLRGHQLSIDADIKTYCESWVSTVNEQFGAPASQSVGAYAEILSRGGKRIRGSLAMQVYESFGGNDLEDILKLARVLEMVHAYLLVIDDMQDNSTVRRGGKTAHEILTDFHVREHLRGDPAHFGRSQAINGAIVGSHQAMIELTALKTPHKVALISHLNSTLVATAMGQFYDIFNEVVETVDETYIYNALEWKTAYYTISNPLFMGGLMAGAKKPDLEVLVNFGRKAGIAFQMSDDILCTFSNESELGKPPMEDMREGKRTLLIIKTLQQANKVDALFFEQMLGNSQLSQSQFEHCKKIMIESGGLQEARKLLEISCREAKSVVVNSGLPIDLKTYLLGLVEYMEIRKS